jgi:hypothetical protein
VKITVDPIHRRELPWDACTDPKYSRRFFCDDISELIPQRPACRMIHNMCKSLILQRVQFFEVQCQPVVTVADFRIDGLTIEPVPVKVVKMIHEDFVCAPNDFANHIYDVLGGHGRLINVVPCFVPYSEG